MRNRCNKCRTHKCRCKVVINKPVEVKASKAGNDGLNNYELWLLEGHTGTLEDYFESIKGDKGDVYIPDTTDNFFDI